MGLVPGAGGLASHLKRSAHPALLLPLRLLHIAGSEDPVTAWLVSFCSLRLLCL